MGPAAEVDLVVLAHLGFVLFAMLGGLFCLRFPRAAWLHLPALAWGAFVELTGAVCPLTPLENRLRAAAGSPTYPTGFVEHHLLPLLYPAGLSRGGQLALGVALLAWNAAVYALVLRRRRRAPAAQARATGVRNVPPCRPSWRCSWRASPPGSSRACCRRQGV